MRTSEHNGRTICAVNFRLEAEALAILRRRAPTPRRYGHFLARLLYEFEAKETAKEEERQRILADMQAVVSSS